MKQIIPKVVFFVGAGATLYSGVLDGNGDSANSATFGIDYTKCPIAIPGTLRNLAIFCRDPNFLNAVTVTIMKNGVATALAATLSPEGIVTTNETDELTLIVGDDICYRFETTGVGLPFSFDMGCCVEFEGAGAIFAVTPQGGSVGLNTGHYAGAFGNGLFQGFFPGIGMTESNTYSICAVPGNITCFALKAFYVPVDAPGVWTAYARKNNILQDGSGGTVNTAVSMADPATSAYGAFTCPFVLTDHGDIVIMRTIADSVHHGDLNKVGIGIGFVPTTEGEFMLCGGSNDVISTGIDYKWNRSRELGATELVHTAGVGPLGLRALGLYIEYSNVAGAPGSGKGYTVTLRRNQANTLITVPVIEPSTSGSITGDEAFAGGDEITLRSDPSNSPATLRLHWGLALTAAEEADEVEHGCPVTPEVGEGSSGTGCAITDQLS